MLSHRRWMWIVSVVGLFFLMGERHGAYARDGWRERPDPPGQATQVGIGILVLDVDRIDDMNQSFSADMGVVMRWRDARLAHAGPDSQTASLGEIWHPDIQLINQRAVTAEWEQNVEIDPDGTVTYRQRHTGEFSTRMYLARFPFDEHKLRIQFASIRYAADEIVLNNAPFADRTGIGGELQLNEWKLLDWRLVSGPFSPHIAIPPRAAIAFVIHVQRYPSAYIFKLALPLTLIVVMSWLVFWLSLDRMDAQIGLGATAVLTLITSRISFDTILPRVPYLTRIDYFQIACTALVFFAMFEVMITGTLVSRQELDIALRIDRHSRWVFPMLFLAAVLWVFVL